MSTASPSRRRPWLSCVVGLFFLLAAGGLMLLRSDYAEEQTELETVRMEATLPAGTTPQWLDERIDYLDAAQRNFEKKARYLLLFTLIAFGHAAHGLYRNRKGSTC
jgi:hypothetical protein